MQAAIDPEDEDRDDDRDEDRDEDRDQTQLSTGTPAPRDDTRPITTLVGQLWTPKAIPKPEIEPHLTDLDWPERSAEVIAHALLRAEYWLSRGGWLREWLRLNLYAAVLLTVAVVLVIPPVTAILEGVRDLTGLLSATIDNVSTGVSKLPPIVLAVATIALLVKLFQHRRRGRRPPREMRREDYDPYQ